MAITVNIFSVSNDRLTISVDVSTTGTIGEVLLWTDRTYKDPSKSIDLIAKVSGIGDQVFTISAEEVGLAKFDGLYFVQIADDEPSAVIVTTASLTKYYVTLAMLISNIDLSCLSCNTNFQNSILFDMYLEAMKGSLIVGRFQDAITFLNKISIVSGNSTCDSCGSIDPLVSTAGNIVSVGVLDSQLTIL
jgi:hypothetical protein